MIEITKSYKKWSKGDRPTVGVGTAEELIKEGVAKWVGDPKENPVKPKKEE